MTHYCETDMHSSEGLELHFFNTNTIIHESECDCQDHRSREFVSSTSRWQIWSYDKHEEDVEDNLREIILDKYFMPFLKYLSPPPPYPLTIVSLSIPQKQMSSNSRWQIWSYYNHEDVEDNLHEIILDKYFMLFLKHLTLPPPYPLTIVSLSTPQK
jgi:hypothetical protein